MKVALFEASTFQIISANVPLEEVVDPPKLSEAIRFLNDTGRYWFRGVNGKFYLTKVE